MLRSSEWMPFRTLTNSFSNGMFASTLFFGWEALKAYARLMACDGAVEATSDGSARVGVRADHEHRGAVVDGTCELAFVHQLPIEPDRERRDDALPPVTCHQPGSQRDQEHKHPHAPDDEAGDALPRLMGVGRAILPVIVYAVL